MVEISRQTYRKFFGFGMGRREKWREKARGKRKQGDKARSFGFLFTFARQMIIQLK